MGAREAFSDLPPTLLICSGSIENAAQSSLVVRDSNWVKGLWLVRDAANVDISTFTSPLIDAESGPESDNEGTLNNVQDHFEFVDVSREFDGGQLLEGECFGHFSCMRFGLFSILVQFSFVADRTTSHLRLVGLWVSWLLRN